MGFISTLSIYHNSLEYLNSHKIEFATAVYDALTNSHTSYTDNIFYGVIIPQKSRQSDENTVYVHMRNTVVDMDAYGKDAKMILSQSPKLFDDMIEYMENNIKQLKKMRNKK